MLDRKQFKEDIQYSLKKYKEFNKIKKKEKIYFEFEKHIIVKELYTITFKSYDKNSSMLVIEINNDNVLRDNNIIYSLILCYDDIIKLHNEKINEEIEKKHLIEELFV